MNWNRKLLLLPCLLISLFAPTVLGQAPTAKSPTPQPSAISVPTLYEQCPALTSKPTAAAGIKRAVTALKDKEAKTRIEAAQQLSKSCDQRAIEPLVNALKDEDPLVRVATVEALGQLGDRATIPALIEAIPDKDWRVAKAIGLSLCSFQAHSASDAALNTLLMSRTIADENDLRAHCATVLAINQLRDVRFTRKSINFVFMLLDDQRESYRQIAEQTMVELSKTRNGPRELIAILKQHNDPLFRQKAAYWLGQFHAEIARGPLGGASIGDGDARVRSAAAEALKLLGEEKKESGSDKDKSPRFQ